MKNNREWWISLAITIAVIAWAFKTFAEMFAR